MRFSMNFPCGAKEYPQPNKRTREMNIINVLRICRLFCFIFMKMPSLLLSDNNINQFLRHVNNF